MSAVTGPVSYHGAVPREPSGPDNYLTHERGILSWLLTLDHKRIGLMYLIGILISFFIGGIFAIMVRTVLWHPLEATATNAAQLKSAHDLYNHMFTLHGS